MMPIINSEKPYLQSDIQKKICRMMNMNESDFVKYGMWDGADG